MRKNGFVMLVVVILVICVIYFFQYRNRDSREFIIYQSYSFVGGGYDDTYLYVIVNVKNYDVEDMFLKIRDFHNMMNGESDKLTINLYDGKRNFDNSNMSAYKVYFKGQKTQ